MKIYFATHATSVDNEAEVSSGWRDVELSELGVRQAKELGEKFRDVGIDLVCCSDLRRAIDTVEIAFGDRHPIIVDKRLREIDYGDFNGKPRKVVDPMKKAHVETPFPNGESYKQAVERVHEFIRGLKREHPIETVLVVGHRATQYGLDTLVGFRTLEECLTVAFEWQPHWEYVL